MNLKPVFLCNSIRFFIFLKFFLILWFYYEFKATFFMQLFRVLWSSKYCQRSKSLYLHLTQIKLIHNTSFVEVWLVLWLLTVFLFMWLFWYFFIQLSCLLFDWLFVYFSGKCLPIMHSLIVILFPTHSSSQPSPCPCIYIVYCNYICIYFLLFHPTLSHRPPLPMPMLTGTHRLSHFWALSQPEHYALASVSCFKSVFPK